MVAKGKCFYATITIGGLFLMVGICLVVAWPYIYNSILYKFLVLKPGSETDLMWQHTPLPLFLDLYLFNITNKEEFEGNPHVNPQLEEIGPFVFQEVHDRVNVSWVFANNSVAFNQTRRWLFVPERSAAPLNVSITNLNIIALAVAHTTKYYSRGIQRIVDVALEFESKSILVTRPAGEWLFEGMNLPLLDLLNKSWIKQLFPFPIPYDKFGFFYQRNMSASYDGRFNMFTGNSNLNQMGILNTWNNVNSTQYFDGYCAMVNGSSGELLPPISPLAPSLTMFITDICSSLTLRYAGWHSVQGVSGNIYVGDNETFSNLGAQQCFCGGECPPEGVRNLTRCRSGAPVFVSYPHFYLGSPKLISDVDGLTPNQSLHEFRVTLEPKTGIPLDVQARLQINVLLNNYPMYKLYKHTPKKYIPMIWFAQRVQINQELASKTSLLARTLSSYPPIVFVVLAVLGLVIWTLVYINWHLRRKRQWQDQQEPLIIDEDNCAEEENSS